MILHLESIFQNTESKIQEGHFLDSETKEILDKNEPFNVRQYIKDGVIFMEKDKEGNYIQIRESIQGRNVDDLKFIKSGQIDSET